MKNNTARHQVGSLPRSRVRLKKSTGPCRLTPIILLAAALLLWGCENNQSPYSIAVYVPQDMAASFSQIGRRLQRSLPAESDIKYTVIEAQSSGWQSQLEQLATSREYDLIVTIGEFTNALYLVAPEWPGQHFLALNPPFSLVHRTEANVRAIHFRYHEMGFLAGYLAALLHQENYANQERTQIAHEIVYLHHTLHNAVDFPLHASILFGARSVLATASVTNHTVSSEEVVAASQLVSQAAARGVTVIIAMGAVPPRLIPEARRNKIYVISLENPHAKKQARYAHLHVDWMQIAYEEMRSFATSGGLIGSIAQLGSREGYLRVHYPRWYYFWPLATRVYDDSQEIIQKVQSGSLSAVMELLQSIY